MRSQIPNEFAISLLVKPLETNSATCFCLLVMAVLITAPPQLNPLAAAATAPRNPHERSSCRRIATSRLGTLARLHWRARRRAAGRWRVGASWRNARHLHDLRAGCRGG